MTDNPSIGTRDDGTTGTPGTAEQHPAPPRRERPSSQRVQQERILQPPRRVNRRPSARPIANVDTLVRKLSRQNLQQLEEANQELARSSAAASSRSQPQLTNPSALEPAPNREGTSRSSPVDTPVVELAVLPGSDDPLNPGCPIEIDQDEISAPLRSLNGGGDPMDVQYDPPPRLELVPEIIEHGTIEASALEVDPAYTHGGREPTADDETALLEHFRSMRRAMVPGGAVRRIVSGVPLRYRLSTDVALSCQNVVRSRPRMRKRSNGEDWQKRSRAGSFMSNSSAARSVASSSAVHPTHSSCPSPPMPPCL
ncbi:hypothetical protein QBC39DRAFT_333415 [Podospora conica]|nr:hypothetical protein QBC39DRAFT_333415 [Schizothecium conicum]